jgi:hypothetical protein
MASQALLGMRSVEDALVGALTVIQRSDGALRVSELKSCMAERTQSAELHDFSEDDEHAEGARSQSALPHPRPRRRLRLGRAGKLVCQSSKRASARRRAAS